MDLGLAIALFVSEQARRRKITCYDARVSWSSAAQALAAAALFGLSPALAKRLGLDAEPLIGSALLYGGAGLALSLLLVAERLGVGARRPREAALRAGDAGLLIAVVLVGG